MCKYSKSCAAITISEGCSYHEIVEKIYAKFKELSVGYSGSHVVDIVVGDRRIVEVGDNSSGIDFVHCESSLVDDCDDFGVNYLKNDAKRITAEFIMKSSTSCKCKMVGFRLVYDIVHNDISDNPLTRSIEVKKKLKKQYGIDVFYRVAWLRVDKAGGLFGDFETSFDQLRCYLETGMRTNLGSVFELDVDESSGCFQRLFVAFHGCLYSFQFCRSLLFVDGTFLKGRYKRHLLAATSKDGNQGRRLTFVSDRQHGLLDVLSMKLRHIARNGRVDSMLDGLQNDKWANAFFRGKRYGEMSSNAAESYNNWIGGAHELPITCMVDMIRVQIMTQLSNRKAESKRWTTKLCPIMEKKLVDSLKLVKSWDVIVASDTVLEVHSYISFYVDIGRQTCSCHERQLNGFPYCHTMHALCSNGQDVYDFIDSFFHVDCFRDSYKESVYLVPSCERFDFDGVGISIIKSPITKK
ncbi:uncharacterized protein LOC114259605 [Camellia sinensis]|uniref:uncharacterized protein LOC114259605 n=1 Tax=Camellia sinensis TaxID=4442 RepID=UPI001036A749|nr:uncharacterized protein LOC114259605 [Camellia sinensis]